MRQNVTFPFPINSITLTNDMKYHRCIGVVSILGLYYYLVVLSKYLLIDAPWDDCIIVHPQTHCVCEPIMRGSNINIPDDAWIMNDSKTELAGKFAYEKFMDALQYRVIVSNSHPVPEDG